MTFGKVRAKSLARAEAANCATYISSAIILWSQSNSFAEPGVLASHDRACLRLVQCAGGSSSPARRGVQACLGFSPEAHAWPRFSLTFRSRCGVLCKPCNKRAAHQDLFRGCFRKRTPGPPPSPSMNSTPAAS